MKQPLRINTSFESKKIMTEQELLIEGCINGDRKCQQKLYETFYGKMMVVCLRYSRDRDEALDVFQEAFIKVFKNLVRYGNKGSFEGLTFPRR